MTGKARQPATPNGDVDGFLPAILDGLPVAVFVLAADGTPAYTNAAAVGLLGRGAEPITAEELAETYQAHLAGTSQPYPVARMPVVRALAGETTTVADMEIRRPDTTVPVEVWAGPILGNDGKVAFATAVFLDISERREAEARAARLRAETVRQGRWLAAVREVQISILAGVTFDAALDLVARRAQELLDADSTSIGIPAGAGVLEIQAAYGDESDTLRGSRVSLGESIMGEVIGMDAAAVLDDAASHGSISDPVARRDFGPAVFVPLSASGRAFGSLCVARRRGQMLFTEQEVAAAEAFANQAALAFRIGQTQRVVARAAVMSDRERIARDLHEGIIEGLAEVNERLSAVASTATDPRLTGLLGEVVGYVDGLAQDVRRYVLSVRRHVGDEADLERALVQIAEGFEARSGIVTVVEIDDEAVARLHDYHEVIVEMVGEALSNVGRHAAARTCRIALLEHLDEVVLKVDDDGQGFDLTSETAGRGLVELASRTAALGWRLGLRSAPGGGTTVEVTIPAGAVGSGVP